MEEVKNILCDFTKKSNLGVNPKEVKFVHRYPDGSGESDVEIIAQIDRVEVIFD